MIEPNKGATRLPQGWTFTTLDEITTRISNGTTEKQSKEKRGIPVTRIETISNETINLDRVGFLSNPSLEIVGRFRLIKGDILFSHINSDSHLGKTALFNLESFTLIHGMNLLLIRPCKDAIIPEFLNYLFRYYRFSGNFAAIAQHAVNQSSINQTKLKKIVIPIAPLSEQRRIVDKVEDLFSLLDAGVESLRKIRSQLKRYRQAVLEYAAEGKLTEEWRKKHEGEIESAAKLLERLKEERKSVNGRRLADTSKDAELPSQALPLGWVWTTLEDLTAPGRGIRYGIIKPGPDTPGGIPYVRVKEMKTGKIDVPNLRKCKKERAEKFRGASLRGGDILISKDGTIGKVAIVPPELEGGNITQHVLRFSPSNLINRHFLARVIESPWCQRLVRSGTRGVALQGINVGDFRSLPVPLPPSDEQQIIAEELDFQVSIVEKSENIIEDSIRKSENLRRKVLETAFEGKLVVQYPTDEPAERLLERTKSERLNNGRSKTSNQLELSRYVK